MPNFLKLLLVFTLSFTLPNASNCQEVNRDNIWMICGYGTDNAAIDFNPGFADTISLTRQMKMFFTNASICDTNGQLLFYTNGNLVCNRFHNFMTNTGGFNPGHHNFQTIGYGQGIFQGVLILPRPANENEFILFHQSADTFYSHNQFFERPINLSYSLVDMTLSGGDGAITSQKNIHIIDDTLVNGRITGCRHANGRDWWIIAHKLFSNEYCKILLTQDTIQFINTQQIGSTTAFNDALGVGLFNPNGDKYVNLNYDTIIDILDFDRCTGNFSNLISFSIPDGNFATLGCAFSSSGQFLYVSNINHIFQFDMWAPNIQGSKTIVATWDSSEVQGFQTQFFMMRLAPDKKIYVSTFEGTTVLHVIDYPDSLGVACNVRQKGLVLPSWNAFSMPNAVNYSLGAIPGSLCDTVYYLDVITHEKFSTLAIFPNPASHRAFLNCDFANGNKIDLKVYNDLGALVMERQLFNNDIGFENLHPGIYLFQLCEAGKLIYSQKMVLLE